MSIAHLENHHQGLLKPNLPVRRSRPVHTWHQQMENINHSYPSPSQVEQDSYHMCQIEKIDFLHITM